MLERDEIEAFLTLAQELHFGRTAERLYVSTASVSKTIKRLERRVGAPLFDRTSRRVALTAIGCQLYDDLQPAYRDLARCLERAQNAAQGQRATLRIGLMPFNASEMRPVWEAFHSRHPKLNLRLCFNGFNEAFEPLRREEIDILVAWLPIEEPDLTVGPVISTEPVVMAVAADHELAERDGVTLDVLADHLVPRIAIPPPEYWENARHPFTTPGGLSVPRGPAVATVDDVAMVVSQGDAVCVHPANVTRFAARPDLSYVPLRRAPANVWGTVWRSDREDDRIQAFADVVRDVGPLAF